MQYFKDVTISGQKIKNIPLHNYIFKLILNYPDIMVKDVVHYCCHLFLCHQFKFLSSELRAFGVEECSPLTCLKLGPNILFPFHHFPNMESISAYIRCHIKHHIAFTPLSWWRHISSYPGHPDTALNAFRGRWFAVFAVTLSSFLDISPF